MADRKARTWARVSGSSGSVASGVTDTQHLLAGYQTEIGGVEIRGRTIGALHLTYTVIASVALSLLAVHRVAMGISVLQGTAPGATTAAPLPGTNSWQWMFFRDFSAKPRFDDIAGAGSPILMWSEIITVRAMRKLNPTQDLTVRVTNFGANAISYNVAGSALLLG